MIILPFPQSSDSLRLWRGIAGGLGSYHKAAAISIAEIVDQKNRVNTSSTRSLTDLSQLTHAGQRLQ